MKRKFMNLNNLLILPLFFLTLQSSAMGPGVRRLTPEERIERELQNLNDCIHAINQNLMFSHGTEQNLSTRIENLENNMGHRLNTIERILTESDENIGDTETQRARLRYQIAILRHALAQYEKGQLYSGHQTLRKAHLTDAQMRQHSNQLQVIPPKTTNTRLNSGWMLLSGIGAAAAGLLSFIREGDLSFDNFDVYDWLWLGLSETAALALTISSFKTTTSTNSIPPELIDQVKNYLDILETALNKS